MIPALFLGCMTVLFAWPELRELRGKEGRGKLLVYLDGRFRYDAARFAINCRWAALVGAVLLGALNAWFCGFGVLLNLSTWVGLGAIYGFLRIGGIATHWTIVKAASGVCKTAEILSQRKQFPATDHTPRAIIHMQEHRPMGVMGFTLASPGESGDAGDDGNHHVAVKIERDGRHHEARRLTWIEILGVIESVEARLRALGVA